MVVFVYFPRFSQFPLDITTRMPIFKRREGGLYDPKESLGESDFTRSIGR